MIKTYILYKDWLIVTRGKILPQFGDKFIHASHLVINPIQISKWNETEENWYKYFDYDLSYLDDKYVEKPYPIIQWKEHPTWNYILIGYDFQGTPIKIIKANTGMEADALMSALQKFIINVQLGNSNV